MSWQSLLQPCLEGKSLGRKQTLTYLKGYQHEAADLGSLMSAEGAAQTAKGLIAATYDSPKAGVASHTGSGSPLPKWVEENGRVRLAEQLTQQ